MLVNLVTNSNKFKVECTHLTQHYVSEEERTKRSRLQIYAHTFWERWSSSARTSQGIDRDPSSFNIANMWGNPKNLLYSSEIAECAVFRSCSKNQMASVRNFFKFANLLKLTLFVQILTDMIFYLRDVQGTIYVWKLVNFKNDAEANPQALQFVV